MCQVMSENLNKDDNTPQKYLSGKTYILHGLMYLTFYGSLIKSHDKNKI